MPEPNSEQPKWSQEAIMGLSRAFMESRVLLTGAELDLFTLAAAAPLTAEQIAERIGAERRALTILLDALAAMGLLVKRDGSYQTEPSAARLLAADSPDSILPIIQHNIDLWERWGRLTGKVAGQQRPDRSMRAFIGAMHAIARPLAARIVKLVDPAGARRLIDVGGGSGSYTLAFLEAVPQMRATIFDQPEVIEMARERVSAAGMLERVALVAGDFEPGPAARRARPRIGLGDHPPEFARRERGAVPQGLCRPGPWRACRGARSRPQPRPHAAPLGGPLRGEHAGRHGGRQLLHGGRDQRRAHRGRLCRGAAHPPGQADGRSGGGLPAAIGVMEKVGSQCLRALHRCSAICRTPLDRCTPIMHTYTYRIAYREGGMKS